MQLLRIHLALGLVCLLILSALTAHGQGPTPIRRVAVTVSDCWGGSIPSATIYVTSIEQQALREGIKYPIEGAFQLRPGRYHLLIQSTNFFSFSSFIDVSDTDLDLRACLTVAPTEGMTRPFVNMEGAVGKRHTGNHQPLWVRLIGLYSDTNITVPVDSENHFVLSRIRPEHYLLVLLGNGGTRATIEVDIREASARLAIP